MQINAGKLQILTVVAMLVLVSGGIAAYAQGGSSLTANLTTVAAASTSSTTSTTNSTSTTSTNKTSTVTSTVTATTTATTTATSTTSTTAANYPLCTPPTAAGPVGRLILPITPTTQPQSEAISFSDSKGCVASITTVGGIFSVEITLRYAKPVTQYDVVLVANGTSYILGNMVTGPDGSGMLQNQVLLKTGTYVVSLQIYDVSSNPGTSTLVLQTGQGTIVSPPFPSTTTTSGQQPNQGGQGGSSQHR